MNNQAFNKTQVAVISFVLAISLIVTVGTLIMTQTRNNEVNMEVSEENPEQLNPYLGGENSLSAFTLLGEWENDTSNSEPESPLTLVLSQTEDNSIVGDATYLYNEGTRVEGDEINPDQDTYEFTNVEVEWTDGKIILTGDLLSTYSGESGILQLIYDESVQNEIKWETDIEFMSFGGYWPKSEILYRDK